MENSVEHKLVFTHVFKDHISRVFEVFANPQIYNEHIINEFINFFQFKKGSNFAELGCEFQFKWKNFFTVDMIIAEVIDTDCYKRIKFRTTKVEPIKFNYSLVIHFYWNSVEKNTFHVNELILDDPNHLNLVDEALNYSEKLHICQKAEIYLQSSIYELEQTESISISKNIKKVWDVVTNWELFHKYVPLVSESVVYDGPPTEVGTILRTINSTKKSENFLRVVKVSSNNENQMEFKLECFRGVPKCPNQELQFLLIKIDEESCFLSFKHVFKQYIKYELLSVISKDKKSILVDLKKNLEKEEKDDCSENGIKNR
jgi:hypothetical protein